LWKWAQVLLSWDDNTILRCQEMITIIDILMYNTFLHRYLVIELINSLLVVSRKYGRSL